MIDDIEDAITLSMNEASMKAEIEANERRLKWSWNMIENRGMKPAKKQTGKLTGKHAMRRAKERARKQAMMNWDE